ncbi:hypothetical protein AB0D99_34260 [Streptomyces sp. NPDC047971]|uniref:hypothetical protein n=1 Tax=Streptomyces sp. NPDC047971 TaxID=3154499 RepID=UPI0033D22C00
MGIESDQLVFDYLSRVGDLAQQRQLPSSTRMRLVSTLRSEIDRRRATHGQESPAAIRGILRQLGTPDEVVDGAAGGAPVPKLPEQQDGGPRRRSAPPESAPGASPPHLAGTDEVGAADTEPDWWSLDGDTPEPLPGDDLVPGFRGGVEIPELLKPPVEVDEEEPERPAEPRRGWRRVLRRAPADAVAGADGEVAEAVAGRRVRLGSPLLLLAALLLIGGAFFGSLVALALGWLLAYASRRLSRAQIQWAVVVLPGLAATAGAVWLWGRVEGRWGAPVAPGGEAMGAAVSETWPWTLKGAALASALFLLWRSRRV